jgi:hypothetical protein
MKTHIFAGACIPIHRGEEVAIPLLGGAVRGRFFTLTVLERRRELNSNGIKEDVSSPPLGGEG